MKAHIVGGGFGGLAAAALLIRNAGMSGKDITIYEADEQLGGGFFLGGSAESGYNLPGSVFDKEFRCTFELLSAIPSARNPSISVTKDFFDFNTSEPYQDKAHIFDRDGRIVHGPRFGLSLVDGLCLARVVLTPEAMLYGRRIEEFFSKEFFATEFWCIWSTIMGSLPQHSVIEFRRYMDRFLYLFGDLSDMTGVMRTPLNQHQNFIEPLVRCSQARSRAAARVSGSIRSEGAVRCAESISSMICAARGVVPQGWPPFPSPVRVVSTPGQRASRRRRR